LDSVADVSEVYGYSNLRVVLSSALKIEASCTAESSATLLIYTWFTDLGAE
jgi:hypothetical protein